VNTISTDLHVNFRLWVFSDGKAGVFGDGKARLLREIDRTGSLRQAALALGISYRKSWGDLKKAEACTGTSLIQRTRGGRGGGKTVLTDEGRQLLAAYDVFRRNANEYVDREFAHFLKAIRA
jgi:molybdate transport repressor ModE-like protein